jgi:hypothetical protein
VSGGSVEGQRVSEIAGRSVEDQRRSSGGSVSEWRISGGSVSEWRISEWRISEKAE